ncbi:MULTISPECIES: alpha-L-fucosidase [unclassified Arcicella]|uniref:alpha-L-fucosidase n=1 Tax=unclassified Arcicella TaxID=2644986 RepID=UPI00285AB32B|nr:MULTISPECIES: alpha-L-fucosidase [unclassified Arcicella]MDR6561889.1 alpha-L-fucosidase [Arcicella sp. BE51]MDR6814035.1 alpha-L-fucosidase [Arcicella sp. BE140]MDR6825258.1 alpha-L-fucosidase [Arcicella sp. BE139]
MFKKIIALLGLFAFSHFQSSAQGNIHQASTEYQYPTDPLVKEKLETWRDQKFGMIIHWGLYAVPGIIESWELCSEDWISRDSTQTYDDYKKWYWGLNKKFNPTNFNPDQWASAAKDAGMKYVVFTTKHHDGFSMFDTKYSDFKISNGPFAQNPKADVAKYVFDAFRKQNFMIGAYFSKPDWHSEYFWWNRYATPDRNVNYDIRKNPWRWNKFKEFSYNQIQELMTGYGKMDILWLDGGWVRPLDTVTDEVRAWGAAIPAFSQEIDMPKIASMARKAQPGLLVVDRTVHGEYENYRTPEQSIPANKSDTPWESCITLGGAWGYVPNDNFKSATKVIHSLIEVVAKGGSLLLGVGPQADGTLNDTQVSRLKEIGTWLNANGEAIYNTRTTDVYRDGETFFTKGKDNAIYALVRLPENQPMATTITWTGNVPAKGAKVQLLSEKTTVKWKVDGDKVTVTLPANFLKKYKNYPSLAFKY